MNNIKFFIKNSISNPLSSFKNIPKVIWDTYFNNIFLEQDANLLFCNPNEALEILSTYNIRDLSESRRRRIWLIILCNHFDINILRDATKILDLNIRKWAEEHDGLLIKLSAVINDRQFTLDNITNILGEHSLTPNIIEVYARVFGEAIVSGNLGVINYLLFQFPEESKYFIKLNNYGAFREAVTNGNLPAISRIINHMPEKISMMLSILSFSEITKEYLKGNKSVLVYLLKLNPFSLIYGKAKIFHNAVAYGDSYILSMALELESFLTREILESRNFLVFRLAAENGQFDILNFLVEKFHHKFLDMIKAGSFATFIAAAKNGYVHILKRIIEIAPQFKVQMFEANRYAAFQEAAKNGHLMVLDFLIENAPDKVEIMCQQNKFAAFRLAAENGHLSILKKLITLVPKYREDMIKAEEYFAFIFASANGHIEIINYLASEFSHLVSDMLIANIYHAFRLAALEGRIEIINRLIDLANLHNLKAENLIYSYGFYYPFFYSIQNGHRLIFERLFELVQVSRTDSLYFNNFKESFIKSAANGHLESINLLINFDEKNHQKILEKDTFIHAICKAAINGELEIVDYLVNFTKLPIQDVIAYSDYRGFRDAAKKGHLNTLEYIVKFSNYETIDAMIKAENYYSFREAAKYGHLRVLRFLAGLCPDYIVSMICAERYYAFREAALNGHFEVLDFLFESNSLLIGDMIEADNFSAFREAEINSNFVILDLLIDVAPNNSRMFFTDNYSIFNKIKEKSQFLAKKMFKFSYLLFAYAEMHCYEHSDVVNPYIEEVLRDLHQSRDALLFENANSVFDINDDNKAKTIFYIIRNLIRRNNVSYLEEIRFLIDIPSVKALLHTAVTPNQTNELLRLARNVNNREAEHILLAVPAVRALAASNNFYRSGSREDSYLRYLAQNPESSMIGLTGAEEKRLKLALDVYQPIINKAGIYNIEAGIAHIMGDLREFLKGSYERDWLVVILDNNTQLKLPFDYAGFCSLSLNEEEKKRALIVYYQNIYHTAFRYLSKPNPWISEKALYVKISQYSNERWSEYEKYELLICMLYLAAKDESYPAIDGHTIEGRLKNFVKELALIGRAHNWDKTRPSKNGNQEEYDDLEGDKPSCYSGTNRRLFQSVLGHKLFNILTLNNIQEELRSFMLAHFRESINDENIDSLKAAWDEVVAGGKCAECLHELDLPPEKQKAFIDSLIEKYEEQFLEDLSFKEYIIDRLKIDETFTHHVVGFGGETNLSELLENHMSRGMMP